MRSVFGDGVEFFGRPRGFFIDLPIYCARDIPTQILPVNPEAAFLSAQRCLAARFIRRIDMADKVLLSVPEAAKATGLEVKSVRAAVARGEIPGRRIGRLIKIPVWWVEEQRSGPRRPEAA